jgi:hypothetical protein
MTLVVVLEQDPLAGVFFLTKQQQQQSPDFDAAQKHIEHK